MIHILSPPRRNPTVLLYFSSPSPESQKWYIFRPAASAADPKMESPDLGRNATEAQLVLDSGHEFRLGFELEFEFGSELKFVCKFKFEFEFEFELESELAYALELKRAHPRVVLLCISFAFQPLGVQKSSRD